MCLPVSYRIGIIGGGQLAMMIIEECKARGIETACLDEYAEAPALQLADYKFVGKFSDENIIEQLCKASDVVTYEFENIDCDVVKRLQEKYNIMQGYRPLYYSKNRVIEKTFAKENGLTPPLFAKVTNLTELKLAIEKIGLPSVLKTCTMGYDGKGQAVLKTLEDVEKLPKEMLEDSILEQFIKYDFEVSCVAVRSPMGEFVSLPIGENIHKNGILDLCLLPNTKLSEELKERIAKATKEFMERADFVGILAIEYFVVGDEFYFNEMAPRPHNSGHYSIEGCDVSQYGMLVDCLTNSKLRQPKLLHNTYMKNILGQDVENIKNLPKLEENQGVFNHDYLKKEVKFNRKMGHITFTNISEQNFLSINENVFGGHNDKI